MTNLIVLALTIVTNQVPGGNHFVRMGDRLVGIKSVDVVVQRGSYGIVDGTNITELVTSEKILSAHTNWWDLPLVIGVGGSELDEKPVKLQSNRDSIRMATPKSTPKAELAPADKTEKEKE